MRWTAVWTISMMCFPALAGQAAAGELETAMAQLAHGLAETLPPDVSRPLVVMVPDFEGVDAAEGARRADELAGALAGVGATFQVVDRRRLRDAIRELNFSRTDWADPARRLEVGRFFSARGIVFGRTTVRQRQESLVAWVQMIETGQRFPNVYAEVLRTRSPGYGALRSALLPGWGQWACGRRGAGTAFMVSAIGLGSGVFYAQGKANDAYDRAVLAGTVAERDRMLAKERDWKARRNGLIAGLGAVWVTNILHAAWVSSRTPIYATVRAGDRTAVRVAWRF